MEIKQSAEGGEMTNQQLMDLVNNILSDYLDAVSAEE